jgi:cell wall-associated NlpC family hydrolase
MANRLRAPQAVLFLSIRQRKPQPDQDVLLMTMSARLTLIFFAALLSACASRTPPPAPVVRAPVVFGPSQAFSPAAEDVLFRALGLVGTPYRWGGNTPDSGFDCSGLIGFVYRDAAGISLPRSTREMINVDAPLVSRGNLEPGDLLFFATNGRRGRVSHAGIYLGDNQFIHSSSRRSGGVRIDSLGDSYWSKTFIEAKRALAMAPTVMTARK